ncbi:tocopherol cyclase family protein [Acidaminobacterium chupaoyuni]
MKHHNYFEGWYFKHQGQEQAFAVIPALHYDRVGKRTATLQIITPESSDCVFFHNDEIRTDQKRKMLQLGANYFAENGIKLSLKGSNIQAEGALEYGPWKLPNSSAMGPFQWIYGLPCYHRVESLSHSIMGRMQLNGQLYSFDGGIGYVEGDRGKNFPRSYLWTQCGWHGEEEYSVMAAVAELPMMGFFITGCVAMILAGGRQWKISTYQGAKILRYDELEVELIQKNLRLRIALIKPEEQPLQAPKNGVMARVICESLQATVRYRFWEGDRLVFDMTSPRASFEKASREEQKAFF